MSLHHHTPVFEFPHLNTGSQKFSFKMDCFQPAGSFKIRGIGHLCESYVKQGVRHFVSSSGGNAGLAAAYAGYKLGVPTTVFVPEPTPVSVQNTLRTYGADVRPHGQDWNSADLAARAFVEEIHGGYVSPFDHPNIWTGHASLVDELKTQIQKPDAIVMSVGGGGLMCGVIEGLHRNDWQDVPVIAVETEGAASFAAALKAGHLVEIPEIKTIATSLGARQVTQKCLDWAKIHPIQSVVLTDDEALRACKAFVKDTRVLVEPACGAALAIAYEEALRPKEFKNVMIVACGGIGMSVEKMVS